MKLHLQPSSQCHWKRMWQSGSSDQKWPVQPSNYGVWEAWAKGWDVAATLHEGGLYFGYFDAIIGGFITVQQIDRTWIPSAINDSTVVVEGGTYLLPTFRGRGLNASMKQALFDLARATFRATVCVFAVPASNQQAITSLQRLDRSWTVSTPEDGTWKRWARRKSFEAETPVWVFATDLD